MILLMAAHLSFCSLPEGVIHSLQLLVVCWKQFHTGLR